jgi:radical SAM protein with 4Fe4S-binding SPASM domain
MSSASFFSSISLPNLELWQKLANKRVPLSFDLEITARCNNACRHCYINLPSGDFEAKKEELSVNEISDIADQAINMGALWCLLSGGEPLLREDFSDIYITLKKKGLLISVFTNACLVNEEHVTLFKKYPPRDLEVTVYGISSETYERVTQRSGSYAAFRRGLDLLLKNGIKIRLKAIAMRSNVAELPSIAAFCRELTSDYFRFDPLLHLRYDRDPNRNKEIQSERLSPLEIVAIEQSDDERSTALIENCDRLISHEYEGDFCDHLFRCGAGIQSFAVSYKGIFRLCNDLWHPDCTYDLRKGRLAQAWDELVPQVREIRSSDQRFLDRCRRCPIINLCLWCPAHAHLECDLMDGWSEYFCQVAHARAEAISSSFTR